MVKRIRPILHRMQSRAAVMEQPSPEPVEKKGSSKKQPKTE